MSFDKPGLMEQFAHICRLLHMAHHNRHRKHGPMADPHRGQGRVLAALKMQPEISQKALSYLLDIRPQSLGELLAKLEKGGFITRTQSDTDNRVMNIHLTDEGIAAAENGEEDEPDMFGDLSAEEHEVLSGYLDRVIAGLEQKIGDNAVNPHEFRHRHGQCGHGSRHGHGDGHGHGRHRHHGTEEHDQEDEGEKCHDCRRRPVGDR